MLVPCVAPKFAPPMITEVPTNPDAGLRLAILGVDVALLLTVMLTAVLVAALLEVSVATARMEWEPLLAFVESHA